MAEDAELAENIVELIRENIVELAVENVEAANLAADADNLYIIYFSNYIYMSDFAQQKKPFVNLGKFMSSQRPVVARPVVARPAPVNTKVALDKAQREHYAAEDAKELKDKHNAVIKTQKQVAATATKVQATKIVKDKKKAAMDIVPNHHDKTQIIKEHNDAVGDHKDAKDKHDQAKKDHQAAKTAIKGGRRRRHTRPKRRKSKHRRRKRRTKKRRKRHTKKRRKRHTKKRRRSRRR